MKISYNWLQTYFDTPLPSPFEIEEKLTFHSFEIEGVEKVGDDVVIDVDVLPNRAHDCLSHRGIAKELSVLFEIPLKHDVLRDEKTELSESKMLSVEIQDPIFCRRYTSVVIKGISVGPSPAWLRDRLEVIGQKSINNVVDATNYIMFGLGQPLHAFDTARLEQKDGQYKIRVRFAQEGEKMTVLSGEEYIFTSADSLIVDGYTDTPIGIAGVKGGKATLIDEATTNIIIESANFHPVHTRKTAQYLKLRTDASTRFENELSPEYAYYGLIEAVALIQKLAGGIVEGYVDEYPRPRSSIYKIGVSVDEVNNLLGTKITAKDIEEILSRFGFLYEKLNPVEKVLELAPTLKGVPYMYGASISYDAPDAFDCSSFIGYVFAQAGVALPRMVIDQYVYGEEVKREDLVSGDLIFSRSNPATRKELSFNLVSDGTELTHLGPQTESQEFLSGTKVEGGVSHNGIYLGDGNVIHASDSMGVTAEKIEESGYFNEIVGYRRVAGNKERYVVSIPFERLDLHAHTSFLTSGNKEDLIEEIGRIYGYENIGEKIPQKEIEVRVHKKYYYAEKIRDFLTQKGFTEVYTYSLQGRGEVEIENPLASNKNFLRDRLIEGLAESLGLNLKNILLFNGKTICLFEIGKVFLKDSEYTSLGIISSKEEKIIKIMGDLTKEFRDFNGKQEGNIYTCNLDVAIKRWKEPLSNYDVVPDKKTFSYQPFSMYPFVLRDIAVWVPEHLSSKEVLVMITKESGDLLIQSNLFDEYKKDGRVSYAFKLVFQSKEKTLSDEIVNEIMKKVTNYLNAQEGFEVR